VRVYVCSLRVRELRNVASRQPSSWSASVSRIRSRATPARVVERMEISARSGIALKIYTERLVHILERGTGCHSCKFRRGLRARGVPSINQRFLLHLGDQFARRTARTPQSNLFLAF